MAIILRLALLGLLSFSCGRWHNDANRLQIVCGPQVDAARYSYVKISGSIPEDTDAILFNKGQWQVLPLSAYGCVEIPRDLEKSAQIAIRNRNSIEGRVLSLDSEGAPNLQSIGLTAEPQLSPEEIRLSCPSDPFVTQKRVALNRVAQPTRLLSKPILRAELYNEQNERIQTIPLEGDASSLELDESLKEGTYRLKLISEDAFERNAPPFESSCQIRLDQTPPVITSSLRQKAFYDPLQSIRQIAPEDQITFQIEDASESTPSVCMKPYPGVCAAEDFMPVRSIQAPGKGLWILQAYATDKTGQKSPLVQEVFAVYQEAQVNRLLTLLSNVNLNLVLGIQPEALTRMHEAQKIREQLPLDGEQAAVRWAYVDAFWKMDQQLTLLQSIDIKQPIRSLAANSLTPHILVQGDEGPALLKDETSEGTIDRFLRSDFAETGALWTLDNAGVLKFYENNGLLRSFPTDLGRFALMAAGQTSDKVVLWANQGQETRIRVYDRRSTDDAPVFKANLPRTGLARTRYSFFAGDRYLIGTNNNQLLIWDSEDAFSQKSYLAPSDCVVMDYAVRKDQKIYFLSQRQATTESGGVSPERSFCDLQLIDLSDVSLSTTLAPRLSALAYPTTLSLSAEPDQNFLAIGRTVGPYVHVLNLQNQEQDLPLKLWDAETPLSVDPISENKPGYLINTGKRVLLMQLTSMTEPTEYFSSEALGTCLPQMRLDRFVCYQPGQTTLEVHSSLRDQTIQPYAFKSWTQFQAEASQKQYLNVGLLSQELYGFFNRETRRLQILDANKKEQAFAILTSDIKQISLHESGRLAFGLTDGAVGVLERGRELTVRAPAADAGSIVDVRMAADQVFVLRHTGETSFVLETLRYEDGSLNLIRALSLPEGPLYSAILYSPKNRRGVVYQRDRSPIAQDAVIFDEDGRDHGHVSMSMGALTENRAQNGFYFASDQSIYIHDFVSGKNQLVATSVALSPTAILEGDQLYAVADGESSLYAIANGKKLATGDQFAIGPGGNLIVIRDNSLKILSPDGSRTLVDMKFRLSTDVESILSSPDHADIVLMLSEFGLGQGIKRLTTDLDTIDKRLNLWPR